ncbi:hypothetical protein OAB57_00225 [Bacteriovoracaceae bacterium]|nr:hypothetical protein [Bacteriovoracaceae bacterium]
MDIQYSIQSLVDHLVVFATNYLIQFMVVIFLLSLALRWLIFYTISREYWFAHEFQRRVHNFEETNSLKDKLSFYQISKQMLEKTYYELFELRALRKKRKPDTIMALSDRIFLIQHGCARLVKDTLKQLRFIKYTNQQPNFIPVAKNVYEHNPCFKRVFGIISNSIFNDIISMLPSLFIVMGIFGTFLGIIQALPELGGMDLNDIDGANLIMDRFLLKISFSMSTSIIGILFSITTAVTNSIWSPEKRFIETVECFENSLCMLWNHSSNNSLKEVGELGFDENKNPTIALAQQALDLELKNTPAIMRKRGARNTGLQQEVLQS